jgi:hypothetical protein
MKKFFNEFILAVASVRAGFFLLLLGTISQTYHNYYIGSTLSSFTGVNKVMQGVIFALFIGGGLLFYSIRSGNSREINERIKYSKIVNRFASLEIFINLYYWVQKQVFIPGYQSDPINFNAGDVVWYPLLMIIPLAILTPLIFKSYSGEVRIEEIENKGVEEYKSLEEELNKVAGELKAFKEEVQSFKIIKNNNNTEYDIKFIDKN